MAIQETAKLSDPHVRSLVTEPGTVRIAKENGIIGK
jgi:hypothetical protein